MKVIAIRNSFLEHLSSFHEHTVLYVLKHQAMRQS